MSTSNILDGINLFFTSRIFRTRYSDDWIDRINHVWTSFLLVLFAILITAGQYVGNPIHCWTPSHFSSAWVDYVKSYCWIANTYFVPMDLSVPSLPKERWRNEITYYQWVPIVLLAMAMLTKIPSIFWGIMLKSSGINITKIITDCDKAQYLPVSERQEAINHIVVYTHRILGDSPLIHRDAVDKIKGILTKYFLCLCHKRLGVYLTVLCFITKWLYLLNAVGQILLLNKFLTIDYNVYGYEVLQSLFGSMSMKESPWFPRVTLCDFEIRQITNVQRYTVQCVLSLNLFNERIFSFLWFWFVLVLILTVFGIAQFIYFIVFGERDYSYARHFLFAKGAIRTVQDERRCRKFVKSYLMGDGVFLLRVIERNTSAVFVCDVIYALWQNKYRQPLTKSHLDGEKSSVTPSAPHEDAKVNDDLLSSDSDADIKPYDPDTIV